jgi:hypothetical protein
MDGNPELKEPVAFIVHVPNSLGATDLQIAHERVESIHDAAVHMGLVPYVEAYDRVLIDAVELPAVENRLREENVSMLRNGRFDSVHISGAQTSAYIREILFWTFRTRVDVFFLPTEGSLLERYARMLEREKLHGRP